MAEENSEEYVEPGETHTGLRQALRGSGDNGLDLVCTQLAVDFQCLDAASLEKRLTGGLQSLTDACGADAVFIALSLTSVAARSNESIPGIRHSLSAIRMS